MPKPENQHLKNVKMQLVDKPFTYMDPATNKEVIEIRKVPEKVIKSTKVVDGVEQIEYEMGGVPEWGLGCPGQNRCGRIWVFIPDNIDELGVGRSTAKFKPKDPAAYSPERQSLVLPEGYTLINQTENVLHSLVKDNDTNQLVLYDDQQKKWVKEIYDEGGIHIGQETVFITTETKLGYLNFKNGKFECDRCGQEVELK